MIEKLGAVHLIKLYGGEGRKYPEGHRVKYLILSKNGTKYQKVARKKIKIKIPESTLWYFTIIVNLG